MLCKDLKEGMLLEVVDDKMCGWLNEAAHKKNKLVWPDIPLRFRVGSEPVGLLMVHALASKSLYRKGDTIMYLGKKQLFSADGTKSRQIRLVYIDGATGYVEGFDFRHLDEQKTLGAKT